MSTALATTDEVVRKLGVVDLAEGELGMIAEYIEDASDAARDYGNPTWSAMTAPRPISRLVASAVARFMRNPDDYSANRASDEMLGWQQRERIDWFTEAEIERIAKIGTPALSGFGSIQMVAYGTRRQRPHPFDLRTAEIMGPKFEDRCTAVVEGLL